MGEPACGKPGHKLDIDHKIEKPAAREDDRIFDECHRFAPRTCEISPNLREDYGNIGASSENFEIFPMLPVGDGREEAGNLRAFDV